MKPLATVCQVPGCEGRRHARGLCITHYSRRRLGSPLTEPVRSHLTGSPVERLLSAVEYDTNGGCWLWPYAIANYGYGLISVDRRIERAHRIAYEVWVGPVPEGMKVCHSCDVTACFNPTHLFLGTQADNIADMVSKGRRVQGRVYKGSANGNARLTEAQVCEIRRAVAAGGTFTDIGRQYGVSRVTISKIAHGTAWSHTLAVAA